MALKNYRARPNAKQGPVDKIQQILIKHQARQIGFDYDPQGRINSLIFSISYENRLMPIKLPARVDAVAMILYGRRFEQLPEPKQQQAYTTAWANIRDWVDAQLALVDTQMVKLEEVFLPYIVNDHGKTFFEVIEHQHFLLPEGGDR